MSHAILLISCPDQKGITAAVTTYVYNNGGNIISADQHIDEQSNTFFMRIEWSLEGFAIEKEKIASSLKDLVEKFQMVWSVHFTDELPNVAIFVSNRLHCLYDLLLRHREGQLRCNIPIIISNHPQAKQVAEEFRIKFHEISVDAKNKEGQEARQIEILEKENIDTLVLARYHQILTKSFVSKFPNRIINIHHSFLPAFVGGDPYGQAYEKGVKIIGATSHYVIEALDQGPIIEQDTVRVTHRDSLEDLMRKGQDLEKIVLGRAVRWHLERKILSYSNKTVVFE